MSPWLQGTNKPSYDIVFSRGIFIWHLFKIWLYTYLVWTKIILSPQGQAGTFAQMVSSPSCIQKTWFHSPVAVCGVFPSEKFGVHFTAELISSLCQLNQLPANYFYFNLRRNAPNQLSSFEPFGARAAEASPFATPQDSPFGLGLNLWLWNFGWFLTFSRKVRFFFNNKNRQGNK